MLCVLNSVTYFEEDCWDINVVQIRFFHYFVVGYECMNDVSVVLNRILM